MTTLDLRGSNGTLRLAPNGGTATVRSFLVLGPTGLTGPTGPVGPQGPAGAASTVPGPQGPVGPAVTVAPGDLTVSDNGDGTVTFATATGGALIDNNDGTATIAV